MSPLFDESGDEIKGALTPEEVDAKLEENTKEAIAKAGELETKLKESKEKLDELSKKDINFEKVRTHVKTLEEELKGLKGKEAEIEKETVDAKIDTAIKGYTGDDKELFDKVKAKVERVKGKATTEEEIKEIVRDAFTLATGSAPVDAISGGAATFGGGSAPLGGEDTIGKLDSPEATDVARKLGITNEELKRHGLI